MEDLELLKLKKMVGNDIINIVSKYHKEIFDVKNMINELNELKEDIKNTEYLIERYQYLKGAKEYQMYRLGCLKTRFKLLKYFIIQ